MTIPNSLPIGTTYSSSPTAPDYNPLNDNTRNATQEIAKTKQPQGTNPKGVILTQDPIADGIPLDVVAGKLGNDPANPSRPSLKEAVFQTIHVTGAVQDEITSTIEEDRLSPELRTKLEEDKKLPFEKRDPDLVALELLMKFEDRGLAAARQLSQPPIEEGPALEETRTMNELLNKITDNLHIVTEKVIGYIEGTIHEIGANNMNHDLWLEANNTLRQAQEFLSQIKRSDE